VNGKAAGNLILMATICIVIFWVFMALRPANAEEQTEKANSRIEAQAPPKRGSRPITNRSPEEICDRLNREDGSWWHCMIDEYRNKPCDIACQLSVDEK